MVSDMLAASLQDTLRAGRAVVSPLWDRNAKDWMMCVHAADIDNDGELEILTSSRDGRLRVFDKIGEVRWIRTIGDKRHRAWVGAIAGLPPRSHMISDEASSQHRPAVIAGTHDGRIYLFNQDGETISKSGKTYAFDAEGRPFASEEKEELSACWLTTGASISQIFVDPLTAPDVIIGSHDNFVYALNYESGELHWKYPTDGWVRAVCAADLNNDGHVEIIVGTNEATLYILSHEGKLLTSTNRNYPIHAIYAADVENTGTYEVLVATYGKDLAALGPDLSERWYHRFDIRFLSLYVTDVEGTGQNRIFAGSEDGHLYILDKSGKVLWQHFQDARFFSVYGADVDNDGRQEILAGTEDSKVHVYRVQLIKDLDTRIRQAYRELGPFASEVEAGLTDEDRRLLYDLLGMENYQRTALKQITYESAQREIAKKNYMQALSQLLHMRKHRVQVLWNKRSRNELGFPHSLCLGHFNNGRTSIIVGTNDGRISIFNEAGHLRKTIHIGQRILDVQTSFFAEGRTEKIVVCTSNHQTFLVNRQGKVNAWPLTAETACIHVTGDNQLKRSEILIGSQNRIDIYRGELQKPIHTIPLQEDIKLLHAHAKAGEDMPEIIAGGTSSTVYAFKRRSTKSLWSYPTWDRIRALYLADIDGDEEIEVLVGSDDRNLYVLDSQGYLRWRYFLPHSVLALQAIDIDQDNRIEILAGCADGNLYVFNKKGELLWTYHTTDRIRAIKAADFDGDNNVEIILAIEDELEVLRLIDQRRVSELIEDCLSLWQAEASPDEIDAQLQHADDPLLRAFAITRLAEQARLSSHALHWLEQQTKGPLEVRRALIQAVILHCTERSRWALPLFEQFFKDGRQKMRLAFVEQLSLLAKISWKTSILYLGRFLKTNDRILRRAAVRQLDQLLDLSQDHKTDRDICDLLFQAAQDEEYEWIRQEAAPVFARLLDLRPARLIFFMHLFIVRGLRTEIVKMIGEHTTALPAQKFIRAVLHLLEQLPKQYVPEKLPAIVSALGTVVDVLKELTAYEFGRDACKRYMEFHRLFTLNTIGEIAAYRSRLGEEDFERDNELAQIALEISQRMKHIHRHLAIYMRRESVDDRLSSLIEAEKMIQDVQRFEEHEYSGLRAGQSMSRIPDHRLFTLLLERWSVLVKNEFTELRGSADLRLELQTCKVHYEEQVSIWLALHNVGRGSADEITLTLLHQEDDPFDVIGEQSIGIESLLSKEVRSVELTLAPYASPLQLTFEVIYNDAEAEMKKLRFSERLELFDVSLPLELRDITNPFSTGTPSPEIFYGREEDVNALRNNLVSSPAQTVLLLYGPRRAGKTTLLRHLERTSALGEHIPVFFDLQSAAVDMSAGRFLHRLARHIAQALTARGYILSEPPQSDFAVDPTLTFDLFLNNVEALYPDRRLIILLDEFETLEEQIQKGRIGPELLQYLRSIIQRYHTMNFLLAGTHRIEQLTEKNWSVFFNLARHYRLSRLSAAGAEDLIVKPVEKELEYAPYTVQKIRQLTADQPYLIHQMCRSLVDHCNNRRKHYATIHDVNMVVPVAMLTCGGFHFAPLWNQLSAQQQLVLAMIAELDKEGGRALTFADLESEHHYYGLPYKREHLQACLKALHELDIVEFVGQHRPETTLFGSRVRLQAGLMRLWLREEKPFDLIFDTQSRLAQLAIPDRGLSRDL